MTFTDITPSSARAAGREPMLTVDDIHVFYGNIAAVKGISLTVYPGEIVTLIGGNGAGKSTTMRAISGLIRPKRGEIHFEGNRVSGLKGHEVAGARHRPEPRGSPHLPADDRHREPRTRRVHAQRQGRNCRRHGAHLRSVPAVEGTTGAEVGNALRRRAADARHGPRAHGAAPAATARRAVDGSGTGAGRRRVRHDQARSTTRAPRSCWSSRTHSSPSTSPTTATCWRPASSHSRDLLPSSLHNDEVRKAYLGEG